MKIGLIDGDLLGNGNHRFPNLALMKLSNYHKSIGNEIELILDYKQILGGLFVEEFDKILISKAFTWNEVPNEVLQMKNVETGGTGFYFEKAIPLCNEIEHSMPDYSLYDQFVQVKKLSGQTETSLKHYTDYSVGFSTRGCFRGCGFCVLKDDLRVNVHSSLSEFVDMDRKKIAMLDDNILGCSKYPEIFEQIKEIDKPFKYIQAMDIRLMTEKKANIILPLKHDGNYYFAFDLWKYKEKIERGLKIWYNNYMRIKATKKELIFIQTQLYCICCYDDDNNYDLNFWINDIVILFQRIEILFQYKCMPFVMRFEKHKESPFYKLYVSICQWANQSMNCGKYSFNEYLDGFHGIKMKKTKEIRDKYPEFRKLWDTKLKS